MRSSGYSLPLVADLYYLPFITLSEGKKAANGPDGSLFDLFSPKLLGIVFQWIDPVNVKSYIRLSCGDSIVTCFIYTERTYIWKHLYLSIVQVSRRVSRMCSFSLCSNESMLVPSPSHHLRYKDVLSHDWFWIHSTTKLEVLESIDFRQSDTSQSS